MVLLERFIEENLSAHWTLYFYIQDLRYAEKQRKMAVGGMDSVHTRSS